MKNFIKHLCLLVLLLIPILAQTQTIAFEKDEQTVYFDSKNPKDVDVNVKVVLKNPKNEQKILVKSAIIDTEQGSAKKNEHYEFRATDVTFSSPDIDYQIIKFKLSDKAVVGTTIKLGIVVNQENTFLMHTIHIKQVVPKVDSDSLLKARFRVAIGTNFDFFDKAVRLRGLYGEVNAFYPNAFSENFGFYGGLYQSRSISRDTLSRRTFTSYITPPITDTTIQQIRRLDEQTSLTTTNNLGLYFAPMWRPHCKGDYGFDKDAKTKIYISGHFEAVRRSIETNFSYRTISADTVIIPQNRIDTLRESRIVKRTSTQYEFYVGLGLPIHHFSEHFDLRIIPVAGFAIVNPAKEPSLFILTQFNLTERKSGINIGGEFRYFSNVKAPNISIYISKVFTLSKLAELISGS